MLYVFAQQCLFWCGLYSIYRIFKSLRICKHVDTGYQHRSKCSIIPNGGLKMVILSFYSDRAQHDYGLEMNKWKIKLYSVHHGFILPDLLPETSLKCWMYWWTMEKPEMKEMTQSKREDNAGKWEAAPLQQPPSSRSCSLLAACVKLQVMTWRHISPYLCKC